MKGNFSRLTRHGGRLDFSTVLLQQGRVLLDSDWNDLVEILEREIRARTRALVGPDGGPQGGEGFALRFDCGIELNAGGQRDGQYGQSVVLGRPPSYPSLPFRDHSADLPYTIRLDFVLPVSGVCGDALRAVLLLLPGRWSVQVERDLCLVLCGPDGAPLRPLGKVSADVVWTLCASYDGAQRLHVSLSPPGTLPRRDLVDFPRWAQANPAPSMMGLIVASGRNGDEANLHTTLTGLRIWDGEIDPLAEPPGGSTPRGCQLVCALDMGAVEPAPGTLGEARIADTSGKGNDGWIRVVPASQSLPPVRLRGVEIGAGQYFVAGLDAVNRARVPWGGDLPSAAVCLFYLEVWERFVSALQYPGIVEPALGGPDTTARTQTVWQVRALVADNQTELDGRWKALQARRTDRGTARFFRSSAAPGQAGNKLYRAEIHHPGWALSPTLRREISSPVVIDRPATGQILVEDPDIAAVLVVGSPVLLWWDQSAMEPMRLVTTVTCVCGQRSFQLANLPEPVPLDLRLQPVASFKWSPSNGCIAFPVGAVDQDKDPASPPGSWVFTLLNQGYNGFDIQPGQWLELVTNADDLARRGGPFFNITAIDATQLVITAQTKGPFNGKLGDGPAVLRKWEAVSFLPPPVLPSGFAPPPDLPLPLGLVRDGWDQPLDQQIYLDFAGNGFYAGAAWWVVPVRDGVGDGLLWPGDAYLPPQGIAVHDARLASFEVGPGRAASRDLRRSFASLVELTQRKGSLGAVGSPAAPNDQDVSALAETLLQQVWSGRARILVERGDALPGLARTGIVIEAPSLAVETWQASPSADGPQGPGVALIWQQRPVFVGSTGLWLDERGAWRALPPMDGRVDFGACACGAGLWLFGGRDPSSRDNAIFSTIRYLEDPRATSWTEIDGAAFDPPAVGLAAVALAGRIHLLGGVTKDGTQRSHRVFDPRSKTFTTAAPMPTARKHFAIVAHEGILYAIGGCDAQDAYLASVECWDPVSDTWRALSRAEGGPAPTADLAAVSVPEGIVVAGGFNGTTSAETWLLRPALSRWQALAPLSIARSRHGLVATRDWSEPDQPAIWAIGGVDDRKAAAPIETLKVARSYDVLRTIPNQAERR